MTEESEDEACTEQEAIAAASQMALAIVDKEVETQFDSIKRILWFTNLLAFFEENDEHEEDGMTLDFPLEKKNSSIKNLDVQVCLIDSYTLCLTVTEDYSEGLEYHAYFSRDGTYHVADIAGSELVETTESPDFREFKSQDGTFGFGFAVPPKATH
jgi:hypothetical protein